MYSGPIILHCADLDLFFSMVKFGHMGGGGGNFGTDVPPDTLKHTIHISGNRKKGPIHISCLRKSDPFIYLIVQNFDLYTIIYKIIYKIISTF